MDGKLINVDHLWEKRPDDPKTEKELDRLDEGKLANGVNNTLEICNTLMKGLPKFRWNEDQTMVIGKITSLYDQVTDNKILLKDFKSGHFLSSVDYSNNSNVMDFEDPGLHTGITFGDSGKQMGTVNFFVYGGFKMEESNQDYNDRPKSYKRNNHKSRTEYTSSERTNVAIAIRKYNSKESAIVNLSMYRYPDKPQICFDSILWRNGEEKQEAVSKYKPMPLANNPEVNNFFLTLVNRAESKVFPCRQ